MDDTLLANQTQAARTIGNAENLIPELRDITIRNYTPPYQNSLSPQEHQAAKRDIVSFLFDRGIVDLKNLGAVFNSHLTWDQWQVVKDHAEDYWFVVAANRLTYPEAQIKLARTLDFRTPDSLITYNAPQLVWYGVAIENFERNRGREPNTTELLSEIIAPLAPVFCAFYAMKTGTGRQVDYGQKGDKYVRVYRDLMNRRNRTTVDEPAPFIAG